MSGAVRLGAVLAKATGRGEPLAGDPSGIVGGKEDRDAGDVVRLPDATEGRASNHLLFVFAARDAGLVSAFSLDTPRSNSVDPNFSRPQLRGERMRDCIHRSFGAGIDGGVRHSCTCNRTYIDDAAALRPEVLYCFLGGQDCTQHVDVKLTMKLVFADLLQRCELVDTGVVHQHVERVEDLFGFSKKPLHVGDLGNVALDGNSLTAVRFDVSDDPVRILFAR